MSLPIIKNATFTVKIQEFQKPLKIRPMTLAEHKAIQMASDIGQESDTALTTADVVKSCTNGVVSADNVPQYILDFVFLQIYISSVENVIASRYRCYARVKNEDGTIKIDEETGDEVLCDNSFEVRIPIENATIMYNDAYNENKTINIDDNVKLNLKSLSLAQNIDVGDLRNKISELIIAAGEINEDESSTEDEKKVALEKLNIDLMSVKNKLQDLFLYYSVESIETPDSLDMPEKDFNQEQFIEWINNCPSSALSSKLDLFWENTPAVGMDLKVTCPKCGNSTDMEFRGLRDFFS